MEYNRILAINPGSTSTKIAVYENDKNIFLKTLRHPSEIIAKYSNIIDQFDFRKEVIIEELKAADIDITTLKAVVGRGGLLKPVEGGVYEVNKKMMDDLHSGTYGEHASNLGALIAFNIAQTIKGSRAFIADPVVVDELIDVARIAGHPLFERRSIFHALNQKAIGRSHAKTINKKYEECNLIIAHLGGGVSVGAHQNGHVIDVNNALDGEGPFSPERSGTLPAGALAKVCFSGDYTLEQIKKMITGKGGLVAYLETNDAHEVEKAASAGDKKAKLIQDAMAYQIGKSIGEMATVLKGKVDSIILTGGIAHNQDLVAYVRSMVEFIAPMVVYPGEDEMKALADNGLMAISNEIEIKKYK
ncbi:MAG: butyrate kinase [Salinivirgaceae bacterium]|nr:butyrate kinase [Salinivirgaceae bacterium]MDD4747495.1 butyrate kinase [Salinivirgaceae bacterium]MDY0280670.1 butyrate kinase [Salinivirgaceae bacterium]